MRAPHQELWPALLEKAYAKFYGSYDAIEGGFIAEAMIDFTGGVLERYVMKSKSKNLFKMMEKAQKRGSLIGATISYDYVEGEAKEARGLISGHAYSITKCETIKNMKNQQIEIVRVRNPWHDKTEWNGPFGDNSPEWKTIHKEVQRQMKVEFQHDGEFYMLYNDFIKFFDGIDFCHMTPDLLTTEISNMKWFSSSFEGKWIAGTTNSPQIIINLKDPDEDDDDDYCTAVIGLMQKNRRQQKLDFMSIKFDVYPLSNENYWKGFLRYDFFACTKSVSTHFSQPYREVCERFKLLPGLYVIVPRASSEGEFMLRIFTETLNPNQNFVIVKVNHDSPAARQQPATTYSHSEIEMPEIPAIQAATQPAIQAAAQPTTRSSSSCFKNIIFVLFSIMILFFFISILRKVFDRYQK
jgi:calpain, invertebrate